MARLARYTQTLFGNTAGANQMGQFGSFAAGTPTAYTGALITPTIIQSLSQYAAGWFSAIVGANSPAVEDWNALCYLFAYQLSYVMQAGIPEWDAGTTYFTGSVAQDGSGNAFVSLTNNNLGNVLTDATNWKPFGGGANIISINPATQSPYVMTAADSGKTFFVNSANGAMQFNLPAPVLNFNFRVVDIAGACSTISNQITFHRNGSELFEGLAADYLGTSPWGTWPIATQGTNWIIV